jgi:hypothetical protein
MSENVVQTKYAVITYRNEGFIQLHYTDHFLTLEESKEIFYTTRKNSPWEVAPLYITGETFSNQDKESRAFYASDEVLKHCSAIAFLSPTLGQKILANFFINLMKSNVPTRFFSTEKEAMNWLSKFQTISSDDQTKNNIGT